MEVAMRIFERLRDRDRNNTSIERRLFETISEYILRRIEEGTDASVMPESKIIVLFLLFSGGRGALIGPDKSGRCPRRQTNVDVQFLSARRLVSNRARS
jgi:hypothetical protein